MFQNPCKKQIETHVFKIDCLRHQTSLGPFLEAVLADFKPFEPQIGGSNSIKNDANNCHVFCAFLEQFGVILGATLEVKIEGSGQGPERVYGGSTSQKIQDSPRDTQGHLREPKKSFQTP